MSVLLLSELQDAWVICPAFSASVIFDRQSAGEVHAAAAVAGVVVTATRPAATTAVTASAAYRPGWRRERVNADMVLRSARWFRPGAGHAGAPGVSPLAVRHFGR